MSTKDADIAFRRLPDGRWTVTKHRYAQRAEGIDDAHKVLMIENMRRLIGRDPIVVEEV